MSQPRPQADVHAGFRPAAPPPAPRARASLNGREGAYRDLPGTGTPVLMVHGIGSNSDTWADIPERLAATGRRVVAVDRPGHGEASRGRGDDSTVAPGVMTGGRTSQEMYRWYSSLL